LARSLMTYTTTNNLARRLALLQAQRIAEKGGLKVNISEVEQEVATYCGVSRDTIVMIKRGLNQPSLPLAMKIARFFNCNVEDIFTYKDIKCDNCGTLWDGTKSERKGKYSLKPVCQNCGSSIE